VPDSSVAPRIPSFACRLGRPLRARQRRLMDTLLPEISFPQPPAPATVAAMIDAFRAETGVTAENDPHIHLEIGFGGGEHLAAQARANPDSLFIGCEPYLNGVAKLLTVIADEALNNIRLYPDDARALLPVLPAASVQQVDILFPDPWPKARHHKRRLVSADTLDALARIQPAGGTLLLATDHADYGAWMLEQILAHPHYAWTAQRAADWQTPPAAWTETRYQRKTSRAGRAPLFIDCVRIYS